LLSFLLGDTEKPKSLLQEINAGYFLIAGLVGSFAVLLYSLHKYDKPEPTHPETLCSKYYRMIQQADNKESLDHWMSLYCNCERKEGRTPKTCKDYIYVNLKD
jgi:hypothetical protein